MGRITDIEKAETITRREIVNRIEDWYDLTSYEKPIIESSDVSQIGDTSIYVLKGHVDAEFKSGWFSSKRGRILFTVKLNAKSGKLLSIKQRKEEQEEEPDASELGFLDGLLDSMLGG